MLHLYYFFRNQQVLYYGAQLTRTPAGCGSTDAPACELSAAALVSFVFYMQSLFASFQSLMSIYTGLAEVCPTGPSEYQEYQNIRILEYYYTGLAGLGPAADAYSTHKPHPPRRLARPTR